MFFHFFNHQKLMNLQCQTWFFMLHVWAKANIEGFLWSYQGKTGGLQVGLQMLFFHNVSTNPIISQIYFFMTSLL